MKRLIIVIFVLAMLLLEACTATVEAPVSPTHSAAPEAVQEDATAAPTETAVLHTTEPTSEPTAEPTATQPPTAELAPEAVEEETEAAALSEISSEKVVIEASDGLELVATFTVAEGLENAPGIILLHMLNGNRHFWGDSGVTDELANNGFAVLALDMRGHGSTGGSKDWELAEDDLQRVWQYLTERPEVDGTKMAVMGGSIGANMSLITAANEPTIRTAVLLSPGLDYRGVTTENRLADYGERPLLIVASENDTYAADSSRTLAETALGQTQLKIYEAAGHGTNMFAPQPDLMPHILAWLNQHVAD